jgi:diguanylate cyclase (GGDEF)-like protein
MVDVLPRDAAILELVARGTSLGACLVGHEGDIAWCNEAFARFYGGPARGHPLARALLSPLPSRDPERTGWQALGVVGLRSLVGVDWRLKVHSALCTEGHLLVFERVLVDDDRAIIEMSRLNNELTNLARELQKKQLQLEQANARITALMNADSLTGLPNRRHFLEVLEMEMGRAAAGGHSLCVAFCDLDFFKAVNDTFGHSAGDDVLKAFARVVKECVRSDDLAGRTGGEEFNILLPRGGIADATTVCERVRMAVAELVVPGVARQITVSIGLAEWRVGEDVQSLLERADQALYVAKAGGRNRVVCWQPRTADRTRAGPPK